MEAQDKFGNEISEGDTVEFYYGGDRHEATVEAISSTEAIAYLTVTPEPIEIPAGQAQVIEKAEKKATHKPSTKGSK